MRRTILFPGQKVVLASGETAIIAMISCGQVYVFGRNGLPVPAKVISDAFGGEHDQTKGLAA